jgi:poly(3-hydroxybutyrate) depolymerase
MSLPSAQKSAERKRENQMRASISSNVVLTAVIAGIGALYGCSSEAEPPPPVFPSTAGSGQMQGMAGSGQTAGAGGTTGQGGSGSNTAGTGQSTAGTGQSTAGTGQGGSAGGMGGSGNTAGAGGSTAGTGAGGGTAGTGGGGGGGDITKVVPSAGCGKAWSGAMGKNTIQTTGTKDPNCAAKLGGQSKCGQWSTPRDYYIYLPQNYDMNKPYSLVFVGPGCGGNGGGVYGYNNNADNTIIRVGLTPGPNSLGHGTNENQGCFDDKEGDDSIDWVLYENLYDKFNADGGLCFDRNRVFAGGDSSGAWFSNELGCKYAGDAMRPVRGIMPNTGGLPAEAQFRPTCTNKGMAGMWIHETGDTTNGFDGNQRAIERALQVNGCTATSYAQASQMFQNFDIGTGSTACKKIGGCPDLYPLVVCPLNGNGHGNHAEIVNPGVSTFLKMFQAPPLLTQ